jgi:polysaccharide export outer membrane protein
MIRRRLTSLFASLLVFLALSCATSPPPQKDAVSPEAQMREIEASKQVKAMNERILLGIRSSRIDSSRDYKIGPEDLLEICVFEDEKLNKTVRVSFQGNVNLPLLGVVKVKGLSASELERELRDLLAEKYFQDPNVSVFIKEYRNQRISIMGAVEKPGVYDVTGQKTILDMLALSGGLKEDAGPLLFLIRPPRREEGDSKKGGENETVEEQTKTAVVDLRELLVRGDLSLNLALLHGDLLNIPVSGKVFVGGEVRAPGGFPLKGNRLTVSQAVALAGGLKTEAAASDTKIFRYSDKGAGKEIISTNVYSIQKGQAEDLYLKENDIVFVPRSGTKAVLNEMWDFIKGRIGGISFGAF